MKKTLKITLTLTLLSLFASILLGCGTTKNNVIPFEKSSGFTNIVQVESGKIQGITNPEGSVDLYAGIPFAKPPVGELRWKEPENPEHWDDVLICDEFKPMAMQKGSPKIMTWALNVYSHSKGSRTDFGPRSEDCLYLNIWTPEGAAQKSDKLPVLVYVHGGSLTSGQSWFESYDGENLAKEGIIVVTVSYRLNVFGYFAHEELAAESPNGTTGNYGLLDQIKALEWVNKNISAFGGDVNNITIAGESAGSSSVNALCATPLTKGMFRRAIAESSGIMHEYPSHTFRTKEDALKMGNAIMKEFDCNNIEELRQIPAEKLVYTKFTNNSMTVDGYALPKTPYEIYQAGENHEEALLNGFNANEGAAFTFFNKITKSNYKDLLRASPYITDYDKIIEMGNVKNNRQARKYYNDIFSVICFTHPHYQWSRQVTSQGKPVYEYYFTKENRGIGTMHSGEMIYFYRNVPKTRAYNKSDYALELKTSSYILNFVKYGNPNGNDTNGQSLPEWKTYGESNGLLLELGEKIQMTHDPFIPYYEFVK